ncbi:hypothetical protein OHU11_41920 (plasmid) [Streptomyces sp. NBC_00257]|uniref:hypothetical protein n=1 Tax=unclassified Streptomyces TaxID=2593676 RepID=UPI00225C0A22|nr:MULTISPECIES: hypothetical protein [unclassified Streptomyces]MCX5434740.1 hypothetical protein [Streptomyces sp. NBC_00062]
MTTLTPTRPLVLTPTGDATPVEKAVADGIAAGFEPETFLWLNFRRPDGGSRIWYAWTAGGQPLGDRIDQLAMAAGCDAADWLHITDRHEQTTARGRGDNKAYALRPVLADVQTGVRSPEERREGLRRVLLKAGEVTGQTPRTLTPRWLGFGPVLVHQKN